VTLKHQLREIWAAGKWSAVLATLLGVVGVLVPNTPLERWSYDLPHVLGPPISITNVVIVYMDDATHALRKQAYDGPWDRSLHAQLVEVLTKAGAKAIAFDVLFDDPGTNAAASAALASAIRTHGRVVLAADLGSADYYGLASDTKLIPPHPLFLAATPHWGFSQLQGIAILGRIGKRIAEVGIFLVPVGAAQEHLFTVDQKTIRGDLNPPDADAGLLLVHDAALVHQLRMYLIKAG
jgi:hypothetical protein